MKTLLMICLCVLCVRTSIAATGAAYLVSPARPDTIASPLTFRTVQTSTESERLLLISPADTAPLQFRTGITSTISSRNRLYDSSLSYAPGPDMHVQLDIPIVSNRSSSSYGANSMKTGLGDILLSVKFRSEPDALFESYYIFTAKFPTGNPEDNLGTGAYDFSFTHKTIFMVGSYRTTLMAGVSIPPPVSVTVAGSSIEYAPTISYMAATERVISSTGLRFGLKAAGLHAFNSRINSEYQKNAVTTLDIIPEVTCRISGNAMVDAGIIFPLITRYDLPGAANRRDPSVYVGISKTF